MKYQLLSIDHEISATIDRHQVSYLEMLGTHPIAHTCQEVKCHIYMTYSRYT